MWYALLKLRKTLSDCTVSQPNVRTSNFILCRVSGRRVTHVNDVHRTVVRMGHHTNVEKEGNPILRHDASDVTPGDVTVPVVRNEGPAAQTQILDHL